MTQKIFRIVVAVLLIMFCSNILHAQISVKSFIELDRDLDASTNYIKKDFNGKSCAIIKIFTTLMGFSFDNGQLGIVTTEQKTAEIWVYVPEGTMKLKISHQNLGHITNAEDDGYYYFPTGRVKAGRVYKMELATDIINTYIDVSQIQTNSTDKVTNVIEKDTLSDKMFNKNCIIDTVIVEKVDSINIVGNYIDISSRDEQIKMNRDSYINPGIQISFDATPKEGIYSLGAGATMRVGKITSILNGVIGIKYKYSRFRANAYSGNYNYGIYRHKVNQLTIPVIANINYLRKNRITGTVGLGYEHGFVLSESKNFEDLNQEDALSENNFFTNNETYLTQICTPTRSIILQTGVIFIKHLDLQLYFKYNVNKSKVKNSEYGSLGTSLTYYF